MLVRRCSNRRFRAKCGDLDASLAAAPFPCLMYAVLEGAESPSFSSFVLRRVLTKEKMLEPVILTEYQRLYQEGGKKVYHDHLERKGRRGLYHNKDKDKDRANGAPSISISNSANADMNRQKSSFRSCELCIQGQRTCRGCSGRYQLAIPEIHWDATAY